MRSRRHVAVHIVARLERMFPSISKTTADLKRVLETSRGFDYPEFSEPKTLLFLGATTGAELEIDADLLAAWICHMSHSSRVRMELLENATLRSLAHSEVLAAATLARAHMEAAAWAAYANEELVKMAETASWVRLKSLVPKMLYGTAVAKEEKHLSEDAADLLRLDPTSVMNAIDALDRFCGIAAGSKGASLRVLYAPLSDYAHPTIRGVRHLFEPTSETSEGWAIQYTCDERAVAAEAELVLGTLLLSMRLGHSASLLMRLGTIEETNEGLRYIKPEADVGMGVWQHIMLGTIPEDA
ncbi:MAG TPA: hypothetical protein VGJ48_06555 [Pyrinomonadaceae bacterium]